ncbi:hypothetical protein ACB092_01G057500 [Castanea dentata]
MAHGSTKFLQIFLHFLCKHNSDSKPIRFGFVSSAMASLSTRPTITDNGLTTAPPPDVATAPHLSASIFISF